jgi:N-acetylneuraminic acid mutarotase
MTLLTNGKVLVAGGFATDTQSAELFDPANNTWSITAGRMANGRVDGQTATLLPSGKVLAVGGDVTTATELFDPASGTWTTTGPLAAAATGQTATLLPDGRVLVAGGMGAAGDSDALTTTQLYDPATGTWSTSAPLHGGRISAQSALMPDGRVLVFGGSTLGSGGTPLTSSELYTPGP